MLSNHSFMMHLCERAYAWTRVYNAQCMWVNVHDCICRHRFAYVRSCMYFAVCASRSHLVWICPCFRLLAGQGSGRRLSKISAVFTGMMGISGTFPTAVKSSVFPAPLNTPSSFLHPARVPIKQLRRLVFGNSCPPKGVINSWKTVFTVKAS